MAKLRSLEAWNQKGRRIHKGSKAEGFEDGVALFSKEQTYKPKKRYRRVVGYDAPWDDCYGDQDYDYDDPFIWDNFGDWGWD